MKKYLFFLLAMTNIDTHGNIFQDFHELTKRMQQEFEQLSKDIEKSFSDKDSKKAHPQTIEIQQTDEDAKYTYTITFPRADKKAKNTKSSCCVSFEEQDNRNWLIVSWKYSDISDENDTTQQQIQYRSSKQHYSTSNQSGGQTDITTSEVHDGKTIITRKIALPSDAHIEEEQHKQHDNCVTIEIPKKSRNKKSFDFDVS